MSRTSAPEEMTTAASRGARHALSMRCTQTRCDVDGCLTLGLSGGIHAYPGAYGVDDTGGSALSSRRFTGLLRDLFENQLRLDGVEHRDDNKGSRFCGIRLRTANDAEAPLLITNHPPPVMDGTPPVTDQIRASDGCDACDGFVQLLYGPLPTLCPSVDPLQGVDASLDEECNNASNTSHPSLGRGSRVTAPVPPVTGALAEETWVVGEWVWLVSQDGVLQECHAVPDTRH